MEVKEINEILAEIKSKLDSKELKIMVSEGHRYYTDVLTETLHIPLTTSQEVAENYKKLVLGMKKKNTVEEFDSLPRVSMFIGQPDTGKTYEAFNIAKRCGVTPLFKMCNEDMNLETFMKDFKLVNGQPAFDETLAIQKLSGTEREIIIMDEWNTMTTGAMKTMQPLLDDTSPEFEFNGKIYKKNMNCKFIITLNDKDKGISVIPDAILSRCLLRWFEPVPTSTIARWTGVDVARVNKLYQLYKICGLVSVFGTRQVKMLANTSLQDIKLHLYGLCQMKNIDSKVIDTLQVQQLISSL